MNYVTEKHYLKIIESTIKGCQRYHLYKKETIEDQILIFEVPQLSDI
jgi:quinol monooxygenase YgiN